MAMMAMTTSSSIRVNRVILFRPSCAVDALADSQSSPGKTVAWQESGHSMDHNSKIPLIECHAVHIDNYNRTCKNPK
jgi:hypothetical protein